MSKVLMILALSLGAAGAANAMSRVPHNNHVALRDTAATTSTAPEVTTAPAVTAAPEIDPAGALSAFTLLAGGLMMMRGRRAAPQRS